MAAKTVIGIYPTGHEPLELCSADQHRLIARPNEELQEIRDEMVAVRRLLLRIVPKSPPKQGDNIGRDNMHYQDPSWEFINTAI